MLILFLIGLIFAASAQDPEETMTPAEMIVHWGYEVEEHDVITDDGFVLSMLRIPCGRASKGANASCRRPPILLVHGLFQDSTAFVMNPPESSPGMILADAGFDVFLLNMRGTTYGQRHLNLTTNDSEFWKFSMDDMAKYDAPAAIDKALALNGASSLYYIGHSQGTMISFLMLAERPEYNRKVRAMFELAPTGTEHWVRGLPSLLMWVSDKFEAILNV
ncbi:hypothetical protein PENTCL1PPCAC_28891, partial [Pristionchus entomophagus]